MRQEGLLDGFPLHLLTGKDKEATTLIIDSPDLGRLQLTPVPDGGKMIVALARDMGCLQETMEAVGSGSERFQAIQADPERLPFKDQIIEGVLRLAPKEIGVEAVASGDGNSTAVPDEFGRILAHSGWIAEVVRLPNRRTVKVQEKFKPWNDNQVHYVRPATGREYFVTREWLPSPWPFENLQLGRLRSLRIRADLFASRLGVFPPNSGVCIVVRSKIARSGPLDALVNGAHSNGRDRSVDNAPSESLGLYVKVGWNALLITPRGGRPIVKFPLSDIIMTRMKDHARNIDSLIAEVSPSLRRFLPQIVHRGMMGGQAYWVETKCKGIPSTKFQWSYGLRRKVAKEGLDFLISFHQSTRQSIQIDRNYFDSILDPRLLAIEHGTKRLGVVFNPEPLVAAIWRVLRGRCVPLVHTHGDFWPGNILVTEDGKLGGILDWDASVKRGWPLLDLLHFSIFQNKWRAYRYFGSVVVKKLMPFRLPLWQREMVREYCTSLAIDIDNDLWTSLVALYWLERISHELQTGCEEAWIRRNAVKPFGPILSYWPQFANGTNG
jgi:hypothetical protein